MLAKIYEFYKIRCKLNANQMKVPPYLDRKVLLLTICR